MELKELYQEIILDHAKTLAIEESVMDLTMMQKHTMPYVETKYTFI